MFHLRWILGALLLAVIATSAGLGCQPVCGNGRLEQGEQCEDWNTANGDGCSSQCQIEPLPGNCESVIESEYLTTHQDEPYFQIVIQKAIDLGYHSTLVAPVRCWEANQGSHSYSATLLKNGDTIGLIQSRTPHAGQEEIQTVLVDPVSDLTTDFVFASGKIRVSMSAPPDSFVVGADVYDNTGTYIPPAAPPPPGQLPASPSCAASGLDWLGCLASNLPLGSGLKCAAGLGCVGVGYLVSAWWGPIMCFLVSGGFSDCWDAVASAAPHCRSPNGRECTNNQCERGVCIPILGGANFFNCDVTGSPGSACDIGCEQCDGAGNCVDQCEDECAMCIDGTCKDIYDENIPYRVVLDDDFVPWCIPSFYQQACTENHSCTTNHIVSADWYMCHAGLLQCSGFGVRGQPETCDVICSEGGKCDPSLSIPLAWSDLEECASNLDLPAPSQNTGSGEYLLIPASKSHCCGS